MMQEHSAEWLRGGINALENLAIAFETPALRLLALECRQRKGRLESVLAAVEACGAAPKKTADERLDEATRAIYAKYGPRLDLFFADVQKAREAGEPSAADVINELREALEEIDGYRGGADTVLEDQYVTERRNDALEMARKYQQRITAEVMPGTRQALASLSIRPDALTAADVIEACRVAIERAQSYPSSYASVHVEAHGSGQLIPSAVQAINEAEDLMRDALAKIAAWEAAQG